MSHIIPKEINPFHMDKPEAPTLPPPAPPPPDVTAATAASDRARATQEAEDAQRRKRGRASTIKTGPEGVGTTPLGVKTLVGS